jgi:TetR/AcrR family transcriptional regulator, fatty acid metabolism regulator protein
MSQSKAKRPTAEERRQGFLASAISLFFEQGVENTTMQQIAQKAGVSYGLFYHYFRSKDDILGAAAEQLQVLPRIKEFLSRHDAPLEQHLRELVSLYLNSLEESREIVWLVFSESRKRPNLAARIERLGIESRVALVEYLQARREAGEIRPDSDLEATARLIWGHLFSRHLWVDADAPPAENGISVLLKGLQSVEH